MYFLNIKVWAYLIIIFLIIIPAVLVGYFLDRENGYAYIFGYIIGGLVGMFTIDLFIGGTSFFSALLIFIVIYLIFWKIWRTIDRVRAGDQETRPVDRG